MPRFIGGKTMIVHFDTNQLIEINSTTSDLGGKLLPWLERGNVAAGSAIT